MLVAIDTGSRRPVKILRARPTRHFLYLLVRCRCGKKFGHRADRPMIVCYHCGRLAALRELRGRRTKLERRARKAAPVEPPAKADKPATSRPRTASKSVRRTVPAPAKRNSIR